MSLVRYQPRTTHPFRQTHRGQQWADFFNQHFSDPNSEAASDVVTSDWTPAVDVKETDTAFILHADIPGVEPKDIDVHMENGLLTIKGQRESEKHEEQDDYTRVERRYGQFYRRFSLPDTADAENINAKYNNGVLRISIPKHTKLQARKIKVEH